MEEFCKLPPDGLGSVAQAQHNANSSWPQRTVEMYFLLRQPIVCANNYVISLPCHLKNELFTKFPIPLCLLAIANMGWTWSTFLGHIPHMLVYT